MGVKKELQSTCYGGEGRNAEQLLWGSRKTCRAVVMGVKEELQSSCYGGEGKTAEQLLWG